MNSSENQIILSPRKILVGKRCSEYDLLSLTFRGLVRLDRETGRIDRASEVNRRQIELLRERRQIVINEVVTGARPCKAKGGA